MKITVTESMFRDGLTGLPKPKPMFVREGKFLHMVTKEQIETMQAKFRQLVMARGLGPNDVPEFKLCDEYGRKIGHVSWNGSIVLGGAA